MILLNPSKRTAFWSKFPESGISVPFFIRISNGYFKREVSAISNIIEMDNIEY